MSNQFYAPRTCPGCDHPINHHRAPAGIHVFYCLDCQTILFATDEDLKQPRYQILRDHGGVYHHGEPVKFTTGVGGEEPLRCRCGLILQPMLIEGVSTQQQVLVCAKCISVHGATNEEYVYQSRFRTLLDQQSIAVAKEQLQQLAYGVEGSSIQAPRSSIPHKGYLLTRESPKLIMGKGIDENTAISVHVQCPSCKCANFVSIKDRTTVQCRACYYPLGEFVPAAALQQAVYDAIRNSKFLWGSRKQALQEVVNYLQAHVDSMGDTE